MSEATAQRLPPTGDAVPDFSLVVATLNDEGQLPGFIESVDNQSVDPAAMEVLIVDLGSTDGTVALAEAWRSRVAFRVSIHESDSLAAARNLGIASSRGKWMSFPEPGATFDSDYLSKVGRFARRRPNAVLMATSTWNLDPNTGVRKNDHPLRRRFAGGDQLVDLDRFPEYFHRSPASAFLQSSHLRKYGLTFPESAFSGSQLLTRYLLRCHQRLVGFVASAQYVRTQQRVDRSSSRPKAAVTAPLDGWRDLLTNYVDTAGSRPPEWVQRAALDTLAECFSDDARARGGQTRIDYGSVERLRDALDEVVTHLDLHVLQGYSARGFNSERRDLLLHGTSNEQWHTPYVVATKYDAQRQQIRVSYRFTGEPPAEGVYLRGKATDPISTKIRSCEYFGYPLIFERTLWLPASGVLRVMLDGEPVEIRRGWGSTKNTTYRPSQVAGWFGLGEPDDQKRRRSPVRLARNAVLRAAASSRYARRRYSNSWVLMDRVHEADDNGERLFEYLRDQRPDINAWFVVEEGTADWTRLRRSEYRRRVVAYGSVRWTLLMLNCSNVASSHVHEAIRRPEKILELAPPQWHFTFLQHGVIKDDISRWVNKLDVDLFITSTQGEFDSLAGDYTPYRYTTKEVKLTGLPRFDRLRRKADSIGTSKRRYILVCPTWRDWLCKPMVAGSQVRPLVDNFLDSEYVRAWVAFLSDGRLTEHAKRHGLVIGFMPHPNFQSALKDIELPDGVQVLTYADHDVQELISQSAVMVTDYSSIAFNAAYIDQAVVYFQFDSEQINSGAHNYRPGYFDYRTDAFGPLVETVDDAVSATILLSSPEDAELPAEYRARIDRAFPDRSGGCCARVTAAIEEATGRSGSPAGRAQASARRRVASTGRRWLVGYPRLARVVRGVRSRWRRLATSG